MQQSKSATGFLALFLAGSVCLAQEGRQGPPLNKPPNPGIQDNSFLIEEAYNQEEGVVQHISNFSYIGSPQRSWVYTFTQEWPVKGQTHQISYTIPYASIDDGRARGIGDILINYRYQLFADRAWAWVSPRLSVILPTGDDSQKLGNGSLGVQMAVPVSKEISGDLVVHGNIGCSVLFVSGTPTSYYSGASVIWRAAEDLNFMLEGVTASNAAADSGGAVSRETEVLLSPGLRFALNFPPLQVVAGIGLPISFKNGQSSTGLFVYLSFEHPF